MEDCCPWGSSLIRSKVSICMGLDSSVGLLIVSLATVTLERGFYSFQQFLLC